MLSRHAVPSPVAPVRTHIVVTRDELGSYFTERLGNVFVPADPVALLLNDALELFERSLANAETLAKCPAKTKRS
jgi:hypothetical protein